MSYFTGYLKKKAFKWAISQLGLFDPDTLLENQDIKWGTTTVIELRDIPLSTTRITELLQLPTYVNLTESRVSFLRLTLPLNVVSNSIAIEIEGVEIGLEVTNKDEADNGTLHPEGSLARGTKANISRAGRGRNSGTTLPTADDLAESFLASESAQEKAEIRSAIAGAEKSQLDTGENEDVGLGSDISLKTFFSNIAKGVLDRFRASVRNIKIEASFKLPTSSSQNGSEYARDTENITFCLDVESIEIPAVSDALHPAERSEEEQSQHAATRNISIIGIHGSLLSTSALSSFMTQLSRPPSPSLSRATSKLSEIATSQTSPNNESRFDVSGQATSIGVPESSEKLPLTESHDSDQSVLSDAGASDRASADGNKRNSNSGSQPTEDPPFGLDSQALTSSEMLGIRYGHSSMQQLGSDLEHSTLSESSESFLSKSPKQKELMGPSSYISTRQTISHDGSSSPETPFEDANTNIITEDLSESKFFSPIEAKSIYMSAMSLDTRSTGPPGALDQANSNKSSPASTKDVFHDVLTSSVEDSFVARSTSSTAEQRHMDSLHAKSIQHNSSEDDSPPESLLTSVSKKEPQEEPAARSTKSTSHSQESMMKSTKHSVDSGSSAKPVKSIDQMIKTLFLIDAIDVQVPRASEPASIPDAYHETPSASSDLPGTFSTYTSADESIIGSTLEAMRSPLPTPTDHDPSATSSIITRISRVVFHFDMALMRLFILLITNLPHTTSEGVNQGTAKTPPDSLQLDFKLEVQAFILRFEEQLQHHPRSDSESRQAAISGAFAPTSGDLLRLIVEEFSFSKTDRQGQQTTEFLPSKLSVGFSDESIVSFNQESRIRESVRDKLAPAGKDICIRITSSPGSANHVEVNTAPIQLKANLNRLAEMLSWLGGLSTVLDLGSSMRSTMTIIEDQRTVPKPKPRGVHFELPEPHSLRDQPESSGSKVNVRIGGLALDVIGKDAALNIEGSALKIVLRDGAVRTQIDRINIYGPVKRGSKLDAALALSIDTLQVSYFDLPKENDLTRLLALLSPSQDRDEQDEDILLDTLLKQRRKGSVLRLGISKIKSRISQLDQFQHFTTLGEELAQLSTVTKYLPEDDKPGLLMLAAIDTTEADIDINRNIKSIIVNLRNTQLAVVTFPSLFLMSIDDVNASQAGDDLLGRATPLLQRPNLRQQKEETPKVSIKFIAGEMEPTLRIKLRDIRVEYHVSTAMAILGISESASGDVIVAEMVNTVANLASVQPPLGQSIIYQSQQQTQKPFRIDVSIRDVVVDLNPKGRPAQALLVLTKSRLTAVYAEDGQAHGSGSFEIAKASFFVIDDKQNLLGADAITDPNILSGLGTKPTQLQCLEAIGYVFVGQTSAALFSGRIRESKGETLLEIDVQDDLIVLESCADSTQTLLTVLGGLAPPTPPRSGTKYRTEIVPVQDMLASFSGHAFNTDILVEDDLDYADHSDDDTGTVSIVEPDDLSIELDLDDDFMAPVDDHGSRSKMSFGLGSVLFNEPGQQSDIPDITLGSFQESAQASSSLQFDENHFGKTQLDRAKEWNSYKNTYDATNPVKIRESPLQIHLKNIHFIWNLYDGYDWQKTRDTISRAIDDIEAKAEERRAARRDKLKAIENDESETVIGDMLFNSIYIGISAKDDPRDLSRRINGVLNDDSSETGSYATTTTISDTPSRQGSSRTKKKRLRLGRSKHHKMTFELKGISGDIVSFPPGSGETQSSISIRVHDLEVFDNIPTSTWRKFATYMQDAGDRQVNSSMMNIEMLVVRPDQELLASEFVLKVALLPLRLHVDQDALDFMTRFFEFRDDMDGKSPAPNDIPFIQRAEVGPVQIKLDFKPKRVDWKALRSGRTSEFTNFIILDAADMVLRRIILYGVRGFDKLGRSLNDIWTPDVKANQLPGVLAGLAPVRPLVNVGLGVRDLVVVPMREYKKDGRIVRAISKGVVSFGRTTTTELAKLGAKLAIGTHTMLSNAEGMLSADTRQTDREDDTGSVLDEEPTLSPYANQPVGVVQGLRGAYRGLERDLLLAKDAIVAMPGEVMESQSASSAATSVLRNAPVIILRPAMGVTKAVGQTLMGAANALDRTERRRLEDKYKHR